MNEAHIAITELHGGTVYLSEAGSSYAIRVFRNNKPYKQILRLDKGEAFEEFFEAIRREERVLRHMGTAV